MSVSTHDYHIIFTGELLVQEDDMYRFIVDVLIFTSHVCPKKNTITDVLKS